MPRPIASRKLLATSSRSSRSTSTLSLDSTAPSTVASTRAPSPTPSFTPPGESPTRTHAPTSPLARELVSALRKRRLSPRKSKVQVSGKTKEEAKMFSSRKYTPLPTSANGSPPRKRAGGGLSAWKRWALIGTGISLVVIFVFSRMGTRHSAPEAWDSINTYDPAIDSSPLEIDETDYSSPPFRPLDSDVARPSVHDVDTDEDEEEEMHILPIDTSDRPNANKAPWETDPDMEPPMTASNPHNPTSSDAIGAAHADADYADLEEGEEDFAELITGVPTSFEDDVNPAGTTLCSKPYAGKPIVQYALTIDAGSTGSRIHVYKFHNCQASPQLEYETFKMLNPGLSAFASDPTAAAASLDPLLDEAKRVVPKSLWNCSPVEVKATAGLRLLGATESERILDEVRNRLETNYPFVVSSQRAVEIMDGKDEGVYAWITANYLLGKIGEGVKSRDTLAVMDLGGASTQIVFEPTFAAKSKETLAEGEHKYLLNFGGKQYTLYQHSYLGYGLMRARRSVHNLIGFTWSFGQGAMDWDTLSASAQVPNPCLSRGTTRVVELDPPGKNPVNVTMHGATGGFDACNRVVELVMAKDAVCEVKPCSFGGVYQPSLMDTFSKGQLLALSYFTDRIKPLLPPKADSLLTISQLTDLAKSVCAGPTEWKRKWGKNEAAMAELRDRPEYCLDLTFMNALLGLGYELGGDRQLMVEKKLKGVELGWALGAGLALVEKAELTCTA